LKKNIKFIILISIIIILGAVIIGYIILKKEEKKKPVKEEKKKSVEHNTEVPTGDPIYPVPINDKILNKIDSHNREWLEKINVLNNKNIEIIWYKDKYICEGDSLAKIDCDNDLIAINMLNSGTMGDIEYNTSEKTLKNVVEKDAHFIKENPSYFEQNQRRKIFYKIVSGKEFPDYYGYKNYIAQSGEDLELNITRDGSLNVYFTNEASDIKYNADISDNVEVVELFKPDRYLDDVCDKVKHKIKSLKYIILYENYESENIDPNKKDVVSKEELYNECKEYFKKVYPDVEIFIVPPKTQDREIHIR